MSTDAQLPDMMNEMTDAILAGRDPEAVRARYGIYSPESADLLALVRQLDQTMIEIQPDVDFSRQLKRELLGEPQRATWLRVRRWPTRVQVAAVAAVTGGFMLLLQRRFLGEPADDSQKEQSAIQEKA